PACERLRQRGPEHRRRTRLQQHGRRDRQDDERQPRAPAGARRVLQPLQPPELRTARQHRRQPGVRPHHEHAIPDGRVRIVAAAAVRGESELLMRHGVAALILVALSPGAARAGAPPAPKRIVALYWYSKDFPSNVDFDRGLQAALQKAAPGSVEYHAEFLESNRFVGDAQSLALRDYLAKKYGDRGVDVLV